MKQKSTWSICLLFALFITHPSFSQQKIKVKEDKVKVEGKDNGMQMMSMPLDTSAIERIMGMKGKANNGEYKVTIPQNDLNI